MQSVYGTMVEEQVMVTVASALLKVQMVQHSHFLLVH